MNDLSGLFGNVLTGPWCNQAASFNTSAHAQQMSVLQQQFTAAQAWTPTPVPNPEEVRQHEITTKNSRNYARWLARILRDPLADCEARS